MKSNALLLIILIVIVAIVGVYFGYNMFFNKPNLTNVFNESISLNNTNSSTNITSSNNYQNLTTHTIISSNTTSTNNYQNISDNYLNNYSNYSSYTNIGYNQYIPITLYNTQPIPTPAPFQQQIAICNGYLYIDNFVYVKDKTLFNLINSNGSNVYFTTTFNSTPNLYSWYLGQFSHNEVTCYVWWIKLDNGIPANSNVTIYMYIGNSSSNYYQQYYPYVGVSPDVDSSRQYDNGKYVFIVYGYFNNTFDGWTGYNYSGSWIPKATPYGIRMTEGLYQGTYILPPNNWNIPLIPLIVEMALYNPYSYGLITISLFGNTSQQIRATYDEDNRCPVPSLSTFAGYSKDNYYTFLKSAVTNQILSYGGFRLDPVTYYLGLIVNSTYAEAYYYGFYDSWVPLIIITTYNIEKYVYGYMSISDFAHANLDYNPFQYGTLQISAGTGTSNPNQFVQWVVARAYPPNGKMPLIYIG